LWYNNNVIKEREVNKMRIEVDYCKSNRKVSSCKKDEAFRIGLDWYSVIQGLSDNDVKEVVVEDTGLSFAEYHTLDECEGSRDEDLIACLHFTSMSFVYINKETVADEWASAKLVISAPQ
jgi:hypothetical protein